MVSSVLAGLDANARYSFVWRLTQYSAFVCDEVQRHVDQSHRPEGHPFRSYAGHRNRAGR